MSIPDRTLLGPLSRSLRRCYVFSMAEIAHERYAPYPLLGLDAASRGLEASGDTGESGGDGIGHQVDYLAH